jgi:pimeloyl-ACP methyl ester carboxylesterase
MPAFSKMRFILAHTRLRQMLFDNFKAVSTFRPVFLKYPEPPTIERLGSINAPTPVVIGSRDAQGLKNIALLLAKKIPHARMVVINGSSHHPPVEKPKQFNKTVLAFIVAKNLKPTTKPTTKVHTKSTTSPQ